jgi:hypothetical protein
MTPFDLLTRIKTTLASVPGVASCRMGLEANITPDDYPLIRIVPTRLSPPATGNGRRQLEVLIYCGVPRLEAHDGLEKVYEELLTLEGQIVEAMQFALVQAGLNQGEFIEPEFIETVTDEDRLPHYKLFALRWRVEG